SIVCFFVDGNARGRGLSRRMLEAAVDYARSRGARIVEAYPVDKDQRTHPDDMFFGAKSIYDRAGFREVARRKPTRPVVRKALRPRRAAAPRFSDFCLEPSARRTHAPAEPPRRPQTASRSDTCSITDPRKRMIRRA